MLDSAIKRELQNIFAQLKAKYTLEIHADKSHSKYSELLGMLTDFASCSENIECKEVEGESLKFYLLKDGKQTGVAFRAIPGGHEFTSLILALLNADSIGKNLPDEFTISRIKALKGPINLTTYMSLSCTNCPEVVQALNIIALLNDDITHEAVDGSINEEEVEKLNIQAVPTVFAGGVQLHVGKSAIGELLDKIEATYGTTSSGEVATSEYDLIVAGGGPAGITAAIYAARKGQHVAVVANKIGGQVNETTAIENIPSVMQTTGLKLAQDLKLHAAEYGIDILENRTIESFESSDDAKILHIKGGQVVKAPMLIIATGAAWRRLNIPGESEYIGRGVAFCPHCDGPFYKGKKVAVIGGGNSGVEAAIDLAGTCSEVVLFEFMEELKADTVLQTKLRSLPNVQIFTNTQATEIVGDGGKVVSITKKDRATEQEESIALDGVFVQIGLSANSSLFADSLECNRMGEIVTDCNGRTSQVGVYAAGDVTNVSYKQIVISMGEGAKAALAAFDDKIRGLV
ncbi:MAG: alkyl hydroperoxide reductase subunit F [Rikenellaceae bacterium]